MDLDPIEFDPSRRHIIAELTQDLVRENAVAHVTVTGIPIRDEQRCTPYNASSYSYPDGLELELLREMDGLYYSPYTDQVYADPREVDIEHIVARSEAHDSGLCAADRFTRLAFASDYLNLTFAPPWLNRDVKVAKDLAEWLPDANRCWYANRVVMVKRKYGLSMDADEAEVARRLLQVLRVRWPHPSRRHPHADPHAYAGTWHAHVHRRRR